MSCQYEAKDVSSALLNYIAQWIKAGPTQYKQGVLDAGAHSV